MQSFTLNAMESGEYSGVKELDFEKAAVLRAIAPEKLGMTSTDNRVHTASTTAAVLAGIEMFEQVLPPIGGGVLQGEATMGSRDVGADEGVNAVLAALSPTRLYGGSAWQRHVFSNLTR